MRLLQGEWTTYSPPALRWLIVKFIRRLHSFRKNWRQPIQRHMSNEFVTVICLVLGSRLRP
ncbi:hypothetical protein [Lysobacter gummosus]|uniref:hypothetical protein n=1 Tax=Lysobacter gummosus TaxID=262324 RepID=UPI00362DDA85